MGQRSEGTVQAMRQPDARPHGEASQGHSHEARGMGSCEREAIHERSEGRSFSGDVPRGRERFPLAVK